jgi:hypothetical protein
MMGVVKESLSKDDNYSPRLSALNGLNVIDEEMDSQASPGGYRMSFANHS